MKQVIINAILLLIQIIIVIIHYFLDKSFLFIPEILIALTSLYVAKNSDD